MAEIRADVLGQLESLYALAYHGSHMYQDLLDDIRREPEVFRLFLAREASKGAQIVGARVVETWRHPSIDYLNFPPIHGKRFSVRPDRRGQRIGQRLVDAGKAYVFDELGSAVIFGESNEVGALAMHGREHALYLTDSIASSFRRNEAEQAMAIFAEYLVNPYLRELRLPFGNGVQFVYCKDERTARIFRDHRYMSKQDLLARYAPHATLSA